MTVPRDPAGASDGEPAAAEAPARPGLPGAAAFQDLCGALFEHSIDGVLLRMPDGTILAANPAACRAFGRTEEELRRLGPGSLLVHDARAEAFLAERDRAGSARAELSYRRADGTPFPVEVSSAVILTGTGERYTSVIFRDSSDRQRVEDALRRSEQRYRTMGETLPYGVWLCNAKGGAEYVSQSFLDLLEMTQEQMREFGWTHRLPPADVGPMMERWLRCVETGEPWDSEHRVLGPDGRYHHVLTRGLPVRDEEGEIACWVGINLDIDERKRAEEALARSEAAFEHAGKLARFGAWWVEVVDPADFTANPLRCSDAIYRIFGYEPGEVAPSLALWLEHVHPGDRALVSDAMTRSFALGGPFAVEYRVLRRDGAERTVEAHGETRFDRAGRPVAMLGALQDVTEQKRIERELRESDRRKTEFLAVLSHELRNPLAPIRNSTFILDRAAPGSPQAARATEVIRRQTEHLTRLVDDLLDVTRISRGKIELCRSRVDLREVVRRACDDHASLFERAGLGLRIDVPSGPIWADADATRVSQMVGNLLVNAAKFTPAGGRVEVEVGTRDGRAEIAVRDTGVGMDPGEVERMFEPFAQGTQTLARTAGGLGLGLALVKGLAELHGGTARARSEGRGRGAEFVLCLPVAARAEPSLAPGGNGAGSARREVLVIEDHLDAGASLADLLDLAGHRVHLARDGRSGIAMARELRPDVILCDIGLPDLSGYEVARTLRADEALRATRLVALTGYAQPEDRRRAIEAGFGAHLPKPVAIDELSRVIDGGE